MENNLKRLILHMILSAYIDKNSIQDFLSRDWSQFKTDYINSNKNKALAQEKIDDYISELKEELVNIEYFLVDMLGEEKKEKFDQVLPKHKKKIQWFNHLERHMVDRNIFFEEWQTYKLDI